MIRLAYYYTHCNARSLRVAYVSDLVIRRTLRQLVIAHFLVNHLL